MMSECNFADAGVVGAEATADYCYAHQAFCESDTGERTVQVIVPVSVATAFWRFGEITNDEEWTMAQACGTALFGFTPEDYLQ